MVRFRGGQAPSPMVARGRCTECGGPARGRNAHFPQCSRFKPKTAEVSRPRPESTVTTSLNGDDMQLEALEDAARGLTVPQLLEARRSLDRLLMARRSEVERQLSDLNFQLEAISRLGDGENGA